MSKRIVIQGYRGSFHDIAANRFFPNHDLELIPCDDFACLVRMLESDNTLTGMMAIENTLYGSLLSNYKMLRASNLRIIGEVYLRVAQQLMGVPGAKIKDLKIVSSHPVAIAQCSKFFDEYDQIELVESPDTALSAQEVSQANDKTRGAIASQRAAEVYGLEILSDNIETNKKNFTRFLVLQRDDKATIRDSANKVSIVFRARHEVGSLHKVLGILSAYNLNMTKIHSAPIVGEVWTYKFFIDFELEGLVGYQHAIEAIRPLVDELKILGIYKKGHHYES